MTAPSLSAFCHVCGAAVDPAAAGGLCGTCIFGEPLEEIGRFAGHDVIEEIARGGMGVVYRARQREPDRLVALKTMRGTELDSPAALARFRHEARAMAELDHPSILPVFTFGEQDGVPFFTMKLATGGNLAQRLGGYTGQWRLIAELVAAIADGVQHAHAHGVLHRDLKPANILFDEAGQVYVSDFGLAKLLTSQTVLTVTATALGTPHYLSPEVAADDARAATTASDVWSLGVMLYELLAQRRPFEAESVPELLRRITWDEVPPLHSVPRDLAVIAHKALAKEPSKRFLSAGELAEDLRRWLAGHLIHARPAGQLDRLWAWARRNPLLAPFATLAAVALVVAVIALGWGMERARSEVENVRAAEATAQAQLRDALLHQARYGRGSRLAGWRETGLTALRKAAAIRGGDDLRDEAIAHLAGFDFVRTSGPPISYVQSCHAGIPESFEFFGALRDSTHVDLHRMSDGAVIGQFPPLAVPNSYRLSFDPAGRWMAAFGGNGAGDLFDVATRSHRARWNSRTYYARCTRDGSLLALIQGGQRIRIIDTATLADVGSLRQQRIQVDGAAICPDPAEQKIAVFQGNTFQVWNWQTGQLLSAKHLAEQVTCAAWQGDWLAFGTVNGNVELTNTRQKTSVTLAAHGNSLTECVFTPDARLLAVAAEDGSTSFWQTDAEQLLIRWRGLPARVFEAAGDRVLTGNASGAGWGRLIRPDVMRVLSDHLFGAGGMRLDFSPDGRRLAVSGTNGLAILDVATGRLLATEKLDRGVNVFFAKDGHELIVAELPGLWLARLVETESGFTIERTRNIGRSDSEVITACARSADRNWLMIAHDYKGASLLDLSRPDAWQGMKSDANFTQAAVSPDGHKLAAAPFADEQKVHVWERDQPRKLRELAGGRAFSVFSPDGRQLLLASEEELRIFDTASWKVIHRSPIPEPVRAVPTAAWAPHGRLVAIEREPGVIGLLDPRSWRQIAELTSPLERPLTALVFSPDSRTLAVARASGGVELWDLDGLDAGLATLGMPAVLPHPR